MSSYINPSILTDKIWNNAFAWDRRYEKYGKSPTLSIPNLIDGNIADVLLGDDIVFEEIEDGELRSCKWLKHFVRIVRHWDAYSMTGRKEIYIFDNHNHALSFWIDALRRWIIEKWSELIHIDEHSDLWANKNSLDLEKAIENEWYAWEFINLSCNVGNYIQPALDSGLIGNMIRIENEHEIDAYMDYIPPGNTILNLDLDIFAPELDYIDEEKKMKVIRNLLKKCHFVTIATSPFFIDQWRALQKLHKILPQYQ